MQNLFIELTEDNLDSQIGDKTNLVFIAQIDGAGSGASNFIELLDTPESFVSYGLLSGNLEADALEFISLKEGMLLDVDGLEFNFSYITTVDTSTPDDSHILMVTNDVQTKVTKKNFLKNSINLGDTITTIADSDFVSVQQGNENKKITKLDFLNGFTGYTHPAYTLRDVNGGGATVVNSLQSDVSGHVTGVNTRTLTLANLGYTGSNTANDYSHPAFTVRNVTTSGASVIANIQSNNEGHINTITTRTMTLSSLGFTGATDANNYSHPSYTTRNINTSGASIVDSIVSDATGHITNITTRTLTLANLGYVGETDANNYVHPTQTVRNISGTGALIIDDINSDATGHITNITTRTLTLNNLGYTGSNTANDYSHPAYTIRTFNGGGATVIDTIEFDATGHITALTNRNLTASDVGALGSGATAVNSALLNNIPESSFVRISTTSVNKDYLHISRDAPNPTLYINQIGAGSIARFFNGALDTDLNSSRMVDITNEGGIIADGGLEAYDPSDIRIKSNIKNIVDPLGAIKTFRTVEYNKMGKKQREVGLIAQDIIKQIPTVVRKTKGYNIDDLHKIKQGGSELIAYAFGAIKQLEERIVKLESQKGLKGFLRKFRRN